MMTPPRQPASELAPALRSAVTRLNRRLRASSLGGVSPSQASALATVERLGSPTVGELAAAEQVRPPTMTRVVDALESDGLVTRSPDASDRRCWHVALTPAGRRELASIRRRKVEYLQARLSELDDDAIGRLSSALPLLEQLSED